MCPYHRMDVGFRLSKTQCVRDLAENENTSQNEGKEGPRKGRHDCAIADILDNNAERDP